MVLLQGTTDIDKQQMKDVVKLAIDLGYRAFDTVSTTRYLLSESRFHKYVLRICVHRLILTQTRRR